MGTRGALGFRLDGQDKIAYNHYDSYPEGLGDAVITFVNYTDRSTLEARVRALRAVTEDSTPTPEDIARLVKFHDSDVSTGSATEWYSLLRDTQGNPENTLEAGVYVDSSDFLKDSLFCEWAYIVNLDTQMTEVYCGFQTKSHKLGRYAKSNKKPKGWTAPYAGAKFYFPVALIAEIPFGTTPDWEKIECGENLEHCHHYASNHFPELDGTPQGELTTDVYLGNRAITDDFQNAYRVVIRGVRYTIGSGRRLNDWSTGGQMWESELTREDTGQPIGFMKVGIYGKQMVPAKGVTWVFPATKNNPDETYRLGRGRKAKLVQV